MNLKVPLSFIIRHRDEEKLLTCDFLKTVHMLAYCTTCMLMCNVDICIISQLYNCSNMHSLYMYKLTNLR